MSDVQSTLSIEYRQFPECQGYEFGSDGSVWSYWGRGRDKPNGPRQRINPVRESTGFFRFWCRINGERAYAHLEHMLCWAFHGKPPTGSEAEFIDGDRGNIASLNLRWANHFQDAVDQGIEFREIEQVDGYRFGSDGSIWSAWGSGREEPTDVWAKLVLFPHKSGHVNVRVKINGEQKMYGAHHLTCWAFHGPCPPGLECCHGNGVHTDNIPSNLRWGTPLDNINDQIKHGVFKSVHEQKRRSS